MGIYGVDFYGDAYYGVDPQFLPSDYTVYPFTAEAVNYTTQLLVWRKPVLLYPPVPQGTPQTATPGSLSDLPNARVRLVKNTLNTPADENDGTALFDLPLSQSPVRWQDGSANPGGFTYYTVWVYDGYMWQRGGDCIALTPKQWDYSDRMYSLLPQIHRNWDEGMADPTSLIPAQNTGPLQRFFNMIGFEFDLVRTETDSLLDAYNPHKCSGGLLPLMANQLGWNYEQAMGMRQNRKLLENLVYYYKTKGTLPCVEGVIADLTGWSSNLSNGYNMVLDLNDAAHVETVGRWSNHNGALSMATVAVGGGGVPANPPVIGLNNLLGPTTLMLSTVSTTVGAGSWTWFLQSCPTDTAAHIIGQGIPLRQGETSIPYVVISRYFYLQNAHSIAIEADFYDASGNHISFAQSGMQTLAATTWERVQGSFTVPSNAVYMVYYYFTNDAMTAGGKIWSTAGQVESRPSSMVSLTDSFAGPVDATKWPNYFGTVSMSGGILSVASAPGYSGLVSADLYPLEGQALTLKWVGPQYTLSYETVMEWDLNVTPNCKTGWGLANDSTPAFAPYVLDAGTLHNGPSLTYDSVNYAWLRIRGERGTVYFDSSSDGLAWTNRWTYIPTGFSISTLGRIAIFAGDDASDPVVNATYSNFSFVPSPYTWQPARQLQVDLRPDRTNLAPNPSFESAPGTQDWTATTINCGVSQSSAPGSVNRWPQLRKTAIYKSNLTQRLAVIPPAGMVDGDLFLVNITVQGNTNVTAPGGWNQIGPVAKTGNTSTDVQKVWYWRFANNEPSQYLWLFSNATPVTAEVHDYYNVDQTNPVLVPATEQGTGTSISIPADPIPSTAPTGVQLVVLASNGGVSINPITGLTNRTTTSAGQLVGGSYDRQFTGPGSVPSATATLSASSEWIGQQILIQGALLPSGAAFAQVGNPLAAVGGRFSLAISSTSPGQMSVTSDRIPVVGGLYYALSGYMAALAISEPVQCMITWLDINQDFLTGTGAVPGLLFPGMVEPAAGAGVTGMQVPEGSVSSLIKTEGTLGSAWVRLGLVGLAPLDAVSATLTFRVNNTQTANELHFLDDVLFEQAFSVLPYFDGSDPTNEQPFAPPISADYLWEGTTGLSPSVYYEGRTRKNLRLMQVLPSFLPQATSFALEYALPS